MQIRSEPYGTENCRDASMLDETNLQALAAAAFTRLGANRHWPVCCRQALALPLACTSILEVRGAQPHSYGSLRLRAGWIIKAKGTQTKQTQDQSVAG